MYPFIWLFYFPHAGASHTRDALWHALNLNILQAPSTETLTICYVCHQRLGTQYLAPHDHLSQFSG
uniref:Uncharacterized protein n=1 Tax=Zea mays TaxID=4577 RepID=C0PCS0_MAIZE|nr:unknown [Zea mays]